MKHRTTALIATTAGAITFAATLALTASAPATSVEEQGGIIPPRTAPAVQIEKIPEGF